MKSRRVLTVLSVISVLAISGCFQENSNFKQAGAEMQLEKNGNFIKVKAQKNMEGVEFIVKKIIDEKDISVNPNYLKIVKYTPDSTRIAIASTKGEIKIDEEICLLSNCPENTIIEISKENELKKSVLKRDVGDVLLGDFDGNGIVALSDFMEFSQNYGKSYVAKYDIEPSSKGTGVWTEIYCKALPNQTVNINDFIIFAKNYGKSIPDTSNLVVNGTFDNTVSPWVLNQNDGGQGTVAVNSGDMYTKILNVGTQLWSVQLRHPGLNIEKGATYSVEFEAWCDVSRTISTQIGMNVSPWNSYSGAKEFSITNTRKKYSYEFIMGSATDTGAAFILDFGKVSGDVHIDNVSLKKTGTPGIYKYNTLSWSDEFSGTSIDTTTWNYDMGGNGWGNGELQNYTNRPENARVENGNLIIEVIKENYGGNNYTSARLKTQGKRTWKYGRFEARMALPTSKGFWPAFWMLGENINSVGWPACGEIDIMENAGSRPMYSTGALHCTGYNGNTPILGTYSSQTSLHGAFHTYSVEWDSTGITWYVDDNKFYSITPKAVPGPWNFDQNFFIILNCALGGGYDGSPNTTSIFPQKMLVDYVRVYK